MGLAISALFLTGILVGSATWAEEDRVATNLDLRMDVEKPSVMIAPSDEEDSPVAALLPPTEDEVEGAAESDFAAPAK